jgi:hypothetical protein
MIPHQKRVWRISLELRGRRRNPGKDLPPRNPLSIKLELHPQLLPKVLPPLLLVGKACLEIHMLNPNPIGVMVTRPESTSVDITVMSP